MTEKLITTRETLDYLRLTKYTLYSLIRRKNDPLPAYRVGEQWRFKKDEIEKWLKNQMAGKKRWRHRK